MVLTPYELAELLDDDLTPMDIFFFPFVMTFGESKLRNTFLSLNVHRLLSSDCLQ